ncbi:MAG TPA: dethiobiotin synthase [Povalibacter sp.]|uniref:ATP-dependent dethiobiotin synthetase BioD n=1 Tax=Povalibacter sp. TaxID=1962978 RepID=UPI002BA42D52|nr:dethiobiotin synthase [Povalibacter sp.]HMN44193.1 dethiobiotin synthase [Povalibacter sp.]
MNRPRRLIGVLGTHTEVGKTWVSSRLLAQARSGGLRVAARKPVQSYEEGSTATDAEQLAAATGEAIADICPARRCYPLALAPPMAADVLQRPRILLQELLDEIVWPAGCDLGLVESVGGPLSPIAHDGDSLDLVKRLQSDRVVLVADAGLGTLNAVRLSLAALAPLNAVVFLNRFDAEQELHSLNRRWLVEKYEAAVATNVEQLLAALQ